MGALLLEGGWAAATAAGVPGLPPATSDHGDCRWAEACRAGQGGKEGGKGRLSDGALAGGRRGPSAGAGREPHTPSAPWVSEPHLVYVFGALEARLRMGREAEQRAGLPLLDTLSSGLNHSLALHAQGLRSSLAILEPCAGPGRGLQALQSGCRGLAAGAEERWRR